MHSILRSSSQNNVHPMLTLSKIGIHKPKVLIDCQQILPKPNNYNQACKFYEWRITMQIEYDALIKNHTWDLVPLTR